MTNADKILYLVRLEAGNPDITTDSVLGQIDTIDSLGWMLIFTAIDADIIDGNKNKTDAFMDKVNKYNFNHIDVQKLINDVETVICS